VLKIQNKIQKSQGGTMDSLGQDLKRLSEQELNQREREVLCQLNFGEITKPEAEIQLSMLQILKENRQACFH
jgi:hypothetical protein